jgi:molybdenum cofactor guanylyltransferase
MTGLLLAGGSSTRMGTDKAGLLVDGEPLARRAIRVLDSCCVTVVVASGDGRRLGWLGRPQVEDVEPSVGPLGGLTAGLEAAATPLVAVLAVDLPDASAAVLSRLAETWAGEACVVPEVGGRLHALHAVWASDAAPGLRHLLAQGRRSVRDAVERLGGRVAGPDVWSDLDATGGFTRNVNTPEDL